MPFPVTVGMGKKVAGDQQKDKDSDRQSKSVMFKLFGFAPLLKAQIFGVS